MVKTYHLSLLTLLVGNVAVQVASAGSSSSKGKKSSSSSSSSDSDDVKEQATWNFGDSLSDNGNLSLLYATDGNDNTFLPSEAYPFYSPLPGIQLQRSSTGKTVSEYIAETCFDTVLLPSALSTSPVGAQAANNFAFLGARAALTNVIDLPYQIASFATNVQTSGLDVVGDRAMVYIGANDVFAAWQAALEPLLTGGSPDVPAGFAIVDAAIASIRDYTIGSGGSVPVGEGSMAAVPSLAALGLHSFVLSDIPDLAFTPLANVISGGNAELLGLGSMLSGHFNEQLYELYTEIEQAGFDAVFVQVGRSFATVRNKYQEFGFTNRDDSCYIINLENTLLQGVAPAPAVFADNCSAAQTEEFLFIDSVHGTGTLYAKVADILLEELGCCRKSSKGGLSRSHKMMGMKGKHFLRRLKGET